ncbi:hypothetical protein J7E91_22440 [Streptomyces sp. ISL-99]|uniref:hypothetical protein n=1 Tax=Streptomyces sp. ISL-99 TaxID=2819193 RepID=UPI001BEB2FFF|nr:hypothetical protein [Streptomyces sp. ISL-99]MBT2528099.1 hypothetical protein [Streptomyces sp. ISL-99]
MRNRNDMTESARPSEVATTPTVPLTSAGCAYCAKRAKAMACPATVRAPWRTRLPSAPPSDRTTTSGSSTETSASREMFKMSLGLPQPALQFLDLRVDTGDLRIHARESGGLATNTHVISLLGSGLSFLVTAQDPQAGP